MAADTSHRLDYATYTGPVATRYQIALHYHDGASAHRYAVEATHACDENDTRLQLEVDADTRAGAHKVAETNGFFVRSVNLVG